MYANTCWGLLSLAVCFGLSVLGLPSQYEWLSLWLLGVAAACGVGSIFCFGWPLRQKDNRARVVTLITHPIRALRLIEPSHIVILGLVIALGGVIWQMQRAPMATAPVTGQTPEVHVTIDRPALEEVTTFFNTTIKPTAEAEYNVLQRTLVLMNKDPNLSYFVGLIQRSIVDEERNALSSISNVVTGADKSDMDDIQDRLGRYYRSYQNSRTYIAQAREKGIDLSDYPMFESWKRLDVQAIDAYRIFSAAPKYKRLLGLIQQTGWGEGITHTISMAIPKTIPPMAEPPVAGSILIPTRYYSAKKKEAVSDILDRASDGINKFGNEIFERAEALVNRSPWDRPGENVQPFLEQLHRVANDTEILQTTLFESLYKDYPDYRIELNTLLFPMDDIVNFREATKDFQNGLSVWVTLSQSVDANLTARPDFVELVNTARKAFAASRDRFLTRMSERAQHIDQTRRALRQ
jgi:hypothetical protein